MIDDSKDVERRRLRGEGVAHGGSGCGGTALYHRLMDSGRMVILWNNRGDVFPDPSLVAELLAVLR